jgi:ADP-ribosylglycohydrolase/protein-tyrosine phosphatase
MKLFGDSSTWPATPVPNSYWVEPGRLLAGEYPGPTRGDAQGRIQALLQAGITSFIDLTGEGELPPYNLDFDRLGARNVVHRRFPIVDHGLPDSPQTLADVAAAIEADLAAGRRVYVHCRAGIGRTGMAVGCYLISQGLDGSAALDKLQRLWQRCSRARSWPNVPETPEQVQYLRSWIAPIANAGAAETQRAEGALVGLAVGEALALATIDKQLNEGSWLADSKRVDQLTTGADTAMTIAAAESLLHSGVHDSNDQLQRYLAWTQQPGVQARVPAELKRVLATWQWSRKSNPGSHDPKNLDAHSMARTLAAALFANGDVFRAADLAAEVSRSTLQSPLVLDTCRVWGATLTAALKGDTKTELLTMHAAQDAVRNRQLKPPVAALIQGDWVRTEPADGAIALVATALDIFRFTQSFEAAIREAARSVGTCGALVGSLAGAHYGIRSVPTEWQRAVSERDHLAELARRFTL